jgi:formylglycine-generating enzyme required for sulfatase activity
MQEGYIIIKVKKARNVKNFADRLQDMAGNIEEHVEEENRCDVPQFRGVEVVETVWLTDAAEEYKNVESIVSEVF